MSTIPEKDSDASETDLYLALEKILKEMSQSTKPQKKLAQELATLLSNHHEEFGRQYENLSQGADVKVNIQRDTDTALTSKQQDAYELCKKLTSERDRKKRFLVRKLLSKGVYSSQHQAKKALKLLLRIDDIPLEGKGEKVKNTGGDDL
jgi:uncharacterized UBP type Zn finger protein